MRKGMEMHMKELAAKVSGLLMEIMDSPKMRRTTTIRKPHNTSGDMSFEAKLSMRKQNRNNSVMSSASRNGGTENRGGLTTKKA